jgi:hypothetical protein
VRAMSLVPVSAVKMTGMAATLIDRSVRIAA